MQRSRRDFVKEAATVLAATGLSRAPSVAKAQTPTVDRLRDLGPHVRLAVTGTRIKTIETFVQGQAVGLVRVRTDDGSEGYGQLSAYNTDITATVLHRQVAKHFLGSDPALAGEIGDRCMEANHKFPWSYLCRALSGVDTAIWDLMGRRADKSVCELLGGKPRPLPVYGSSMSREIKPADEAARLVRLRDQKGFRAFKIRIGKECGNDQDTWPGRTEEIVPTVRKAIGEGVRLFVDANSCYTPDKAIHVGKNLLADNQVSHYEEPCPHWELEWTARVAATLDIPVAGGEQDNDLAHWRRMIAMDAVDIVQPDVNYVGGLTRALRVCRMAEAAGKPVVPHSANVSMITLFTLHLMAAIPNAGPYVEFSIEKGGWAEGIYEPVLEVVDGKVAVPAGPGWGVQVRKDWLEKATRQVSETA